MEGHSLQGAVDPRMSLNVVVQQFLEAVVHSILYHRNVYPPESFDKTQLYGMVVHQNRHPLVTDYVREVATKATAISHTLGEVRVIIFNGDGGAGGVSATDSFVCSSVGVGVGKDGAGALATPVASSASFSSFFFPHSFACPSRQCVR